MASAIAVCNLVKMAIKEYTKTVSKLSVLPLIKLLTKVTKAAAALKTLWAVLQQLMLKIINIIQLELDPGVVIIQHNYTKRVYCSLYSSSDGLGPASSSTGPFGDESSSATSAMYAVWLCRCMKSPLEGLTEDALRFLCRSNTEANSRASGWPTNIHVSP